MAGRHEILKPRPWQSRSYEVEGEANAKHIVINKTYQMTTDDDNRQLDFYRAGTDKLVTINRSVLIHF